MSARKLYVAQTVFTDNGFSHAAKIPAGASPRPTAQGFRINDQLVVEREIQIKKENI